VSALSIYVLLALIAWPLVTLLAYIGSRVRDLPNVMTLILQACWFVSPIFFEADMFRRAGLGALVDDNPVYHLLQIVRAPLLEGRWPTATNYSFCLGTALFFAVCAWLVGRKAERRVIFYL
jgi:lipopolysaccharide transport system permease protein